MKSLKCVKCKKLKSGVEMKNVIIGLLCLTLALGIIGCSEPNDPAFRIKNDRLNKANVQLKTSGGNTININDVLSGQITAYQSVSRGQITVTAVIQNEPESPSISFYAINDARYTIEIQSGNKPTLRISQE